MKIELLTITEGAEKHIERCTRTCYNSLGKMTDDSYKTFLPKIIRAGHFSALSHAHASFLIYGISRACLAQITRHAHLRYLVESQRYNAYITEEDKNKRKRKLQYLDGNKRHSNCKITLGQEREICDLYESGYSCEQIVDKTDLQIHRSSIRSALLYNNIKMRGNNETRLNHEFFDKIGPRQAYILGFILADGSLSKDTDSIKIELHYQDYHILEYIKKELNIFNRIYWDTNPERGNDSCILKFCSTRIYNRLLDLGFRPNKTYGETNYDKLYKNIPDKYMSNFILGIFDGDGCYYKFNNNVQISFVDSHEQHISLLKKILVSKTNISTKPKINKKGEYVYSIVWGGVDQVKKIIEYLYSNIPCSYSFLRRKAIKISETYSSVNDKISNIIMKENPNFIFPLSVRKSLESMFSMRDSYNSQNDTYRDFYIDNINPEDCRMVLPNGYITNMVMSGNLQAWWDFLRLRLTKKAQWEIREVARSIYSILNEKCPFIFTKELLEVQPKIRLDLED